MLHVVLYEPEIPQNTGNIIRTCLATKSKLHLIKPYGFFLDSKMVKRSSINYQTKLIINEHLNWQEFLKKVCPERKNLFFITRYGSTAPSNVKFASLKEPTYFIFGRESTGIPKPILQTSLENCLRLPMVPEMRSLNVANTVAVLVYEYQRQQNYLELATNEVQKGADFLKNNC